MQPGSNSSCRSRAGKATAARPTCGRASFETLTHAAALAAVTRNIAIFATVHVPLVHPVFAAKALMTVDHVSRGRAGLNIVCGWNQGEFDMFGHRQSEHDDRYDQGHEWYAILTRIYESEVPFDYQGKFYDLKQVIGAPAPVQQPRPVTLSAAFSPAGRQFAAKTSDFLFTTFRSFETVKPHIAEIERYASEAGREVGVLTTTHVVCRETEAEAHAVLPVLRRGERRRRRRDLPPAHERSALRRASNRMSCSSSAGDMPVVRAAIRWSERRSRSLTK